jgi:uncharacterized membrane protein
VSGPRWLAPAIVAASVAAAAVALAIGGGSPLRTALALWFLLLCPGLAVGPLLPIRDTWAMLALVLGLSVAIDTVVVSALMYAGAWSTPVIFSALAAMSLAGAAAQLAWRARA